MAKLAHAEAHRKYDMAAAQLEAIRLRSVQLLTFGTASISFLAARVVSEDLGTAERTVAIVASTIFLVFAVLSVRLLVPVQKWKRAIEAEAILDQYLDAEVGGDAPVAAYERVAKIVSEDASQNREKVDDLVKFVPLSAALAALTFTLWLGLAVFVS